MSNGVVDMGNGIQSKRLHARARKHKLIITTITDITTITTITTVTTMTTITITITITRLLSLVHNGNHTYY